MVVKLLIVAAIKPNQYYTNKKKIHKVKKIKIKNLQNKNKKVIYI